MASLGPLLSGQKNAPPALNLSGLPGAPAGASNASMMQQQPQSQSNATPLSLPSLPNSSGVQPAQAGMPSSGGGKGQQIMQMIGPMFSAMGNF